MELDEDEMLCDDGAGVNLTPPIAIVDEIESRWNNGGCLVDQLLILYVIRVVFNLDCWFRVSSGAADLEDWERDLVRDVESIFGRYAM